MSRFSLLFAVIFIVFPFAMAAAPRHRRAFCFRLFYERGSELFFMPLCRAAMLAIAKMMSVQRSHAMLELMEPRQFFTIFRKIDDKAARQHAAALSLHPPRRHIYIDIAVFGLLEYLSIFFDTPARAVIVL